MLGTQAVTQIEVQERNEKTKTSKVKTGEKSRCASAVHAVSRSGAEDGLLGDAGFGHVDKDWNLQYSTAGSSRLRHYLIGGAVSCSRKR
jgi:hypothetical protein